jgi:hypothetical protein
MSAPVISSRFLNIVEPVIGSMPAGPLRESLLAGYTEETESLKAIEKCFILLISKVHDAEQLRSFFHCWARTNNSASSVAGLVCRITLSAKSLPKEV